MIAATLQAFIDLFALVISTEFVVFLGGCFAVAIACKLAWWLLGVTE